jgi:hypothetical protein
MLGVAVVGVVGKYMIVPPVCSRTPSAGMCTPGPTPEQSTVTFSPLAVENPGTAPPLAKLQPLSSTHCVKVFGALRVGDTAGVSAPGVTRDGKFVHAEVTTPAPVVTGEHAASVTLGTHSETVWGERTTESS